MKSDYKKINDRFIKALNDCITRKEIKNRVELSKLLHTTPATITQISKYAQNVPYLLLIEFCKRFNVSANYILFNEGPQRISESKKDTLEDLISRVTELERKNK